MQIRKLAVVFAFLSVITSMPACSQPPAQVSDLGSKVYAPLADRMTVTKTRAKLPEIRRISIVETDELQKIELASTEKAPKVNITRIYDKPKPPSKKSAKKKSAKTGKSKKSVKKAAEKSYFSASGRTIKVRKGDTLHKIARTYRKDHKDIIKANKLKYPYHVQAGQKLVIPGSMSISDVAAGKKSVKKVAAKSTKKSHKKTAAKPRIKSKAIQKASLKPSKSITKSKGNGKFLWPVRGKVISSFGAKKGGVHNDGINISAPEGSAVKAAASGTVIYVGSELREYGNLVIIRHGNGWITAYAHQKAVRVKKGAKVRKGEVIGKVGKTGSVSKPQLHFAVRKGRKARNPMKYL